MAGPTPDVTATPAGPSPTGDTGGRAGLLDRPAPGVAASQRARAGRADTLAALRSGKLDDAKPSTPPRQPVERAAAPPPAAADDDPDLDDGGGSEQPGGRAAAKKPETEKKPAREAEDDPETTRRIGKITDAEKRARAQIATERADLEKADKQLEEKWAPRQKAVEEFERMRGEAKAAVNNPAKLAKLMSSLGLTETHFETMAQVLYSLSPAGKADPARQKHVERITRDLRQAEELEERDIANASRIEKLEKKLEDKDRAAEFSTRQREYLDDAVAAIADEFPIAATALEKAASAADATPEDRKAAATRRRKLEAQLWEAAVDLHQNGDDPSGPAPDPRDVIAHFEKLRGEQLDELGIARPTRESKPTGKPAEKKTPATTLSSDLSTARVPRPSLGGREHRAETRRLLEQGKHS
jgi:hypothetical protein